MSSLKEAQGHNNGSIQRHLLSKAGRKRSDGIRRSRKEHKSTKPDRKDTTWTGDSNTNVKPEKKGLYTDASFPPDKTSLTYVYSGDDKYDAMVFKRPKELVENPVMLGIGGSSPVLPPSGRWSVGRAWFQHAVSIVSLNVTYMEKLIPSFNLFLQNFQDNYTGSFRLCLWRFGEWIDVQIDDNLPVLTDRLAYCPAFGDPPEFWPALLEKAYAKCHKAYEAVEVGNPLNALVDLTGAVCEHYTLENHYTDDFFHIIYRSCVNRSMVICWRTSKSFKQPGFRGRMRKHISDENLTAEIAWSEDTLEYGPNFLYIVTAATKFPLRDGRMVEMLRIKDPHDSIAAWTGDFSREKTASWNSVNPTFMENYKPRDCVCENEFWITYQDFLGHFGDLVICSSNEPFECPSWDGPRKYKASDMNIASELSKSCCDLSVEKVGRTSSCSGLLDVPGTLLAKRKLSLGIIVKESKETVKIDNVDSCKSAADLAQREPRGLFIRRFSAREEDIHQEPELLKHANSFRQVKSRASLLRDESSNIPAIRRTPPSVKSNKSKTAQGRSFSRNGSLQSSQSGQSTHSLLSSQSGVTDSAAIDLTHHDSIASNLSALSCGSITDSDHGSLYSTSEIKIKVNECSNQPRNQRIHSAPFLVRERVSSLRPNHTNIFEARMDYFRSRGSWREIVTHFGKWTKETSGGPRLNIKHHSKNPRISFALMKPETYNEVIPESLQGKSHVIISVMQDYRQGSLTSNTMPINIGFALYKAKHPERDEKRSLVKLPLVADVASEKEARHLTARFDLDAGHYIVVPYTITAGFEGDFLIRILGERDKIPGGTGCVIS